jgi:cell division septal protein FtsQ
MRVWDRICWAFTFLRNAEEIIAAMASVEAAITKRVDELTELHADLARQVGIQQGAVEKQLADLRAIVTQLGEQAKQKPVAAGNMADVRRFLGDPE